MLQILNEDLQQPYLIYIRGSADIDRNNDFGANQEYPFIFNDINALAALNKHQYVTKTLYQYIPEFFNNDHLPNLRASFIKHTLYNSNYGFKPDRISILDGGVTEKVDARDRNVMILLFVDWQVSEQN